MLRTILLVVLLAGNAYAFKWPWEVELNAVKVDVAKEAKTLAEVKVDVGANAKALADLKIQVDSMKAQGNAVAALKSDISQIQTDMKAGGNITTTTGASDTLIKFIFGKWYLFLGAFLTFFGTLVAQYERLLLAKDAQIKHLMDYTEASDKAQDDWLTKFIQAQTDRIKELTDAIQKRG